MVFFLVFNGFQDSAAQTTVTPSTLYGISNFNSDQLLSINSATGVAIEIGSLNLPGGFGCGALAFHPITGVLYATCPEDNPPGIHFYEVDTATGAATDIGFTGINRSVMDLSFRSDGTLFALHFDVDSQNQFNRFFLALSIIDTNTGIATRVSPGHTGLETGLNKGNAIAFTSSDILLHSSSVVDGLTNNLKTIDTITQTPSLLVNDATFVGFPAPQGFFRNAAMDFDPFTGILFSATMDGQGFGPTYLSYVNPQTGIVTHIGQTVDGLDAIAVQPFEEVVPITCGPNTFESAGECLPIGDLNFCGAGTTPVGGFCLPVANGGFECGSKTMEVAGICLPDLPLICGDGTFIQNMMCFATSSGQVIGGYLIDINSASLFVAAIGVNPVITGLVGITLAGIAGQAAWFVHRRKKKVE